MEGPCIINTENFLFSAIRRCYTSLFICSIRGRKIIILYCENNQKMQANLWETDLKKWWDRFRRRGHTAETMPPCPWQRVPSLLEGCWQCHCQQLLLCRAANDIQGHTGHPAAAAVVFSFTRLAVVFSFMSQVLEASNHITTSTYLFF